MMLTNVPTGRMPESDIVKLVDLPLSFDYGACRRVQREVNFKLGNGEEQQVVVRLFRGVKDPNHNKFLVFYYQEGLFEQVKRMILEGAIFSKVARLDDEGRAEKKMKPKHVDTGLF